jgi:hypothetical protein
MALVQDGKSDCDRCLSSIAWRSRSCQRMPISNLIPVTGPPNFLLSEALVFEQKAGRGEVATSRPAPP